MIPLVDFLKVAQRVKSIVCALRYFAFRVLSPSGSTKMFFKKHFRY